MKRGPRKGPLVGTTTIAQLCHVGVSTAIRWLDRGLLPSLRLPSGHRRARREDVLALKKEYGIP